MASVPKPMRNWAAVDPLMLKGGVHGTSKDELRPRLDWRAAWDDFADWRGDENASWGDDRKSDEQKEGPQGPSSFLALC